jgi:hypothetical protein
MPPKPALRTTTRRRASGNAAGGCGLPGRWVRSPRAGCSPVRLRRLLWLTNGSIQRSHSGERTASNEQYGWAGAPDEDVAALRVRIAKDLALAADGAERRLAARAAELYGEAFARTAAITSTPQPCGSWPVTPAGGLIPETRRPPE